LSNVEKFNNVQCESCHGPGDLHVLSKGEQSMTPLPVLETCLKCHTPERSGDEGFEYRVTDICGNKK
jgi:mono/diheme cytochrome c family protein